MTTVSHVKLERCVLKVQVMVRLLFNSCQRQILEPSRQCSMTGSYRNF